MKKTAERETDRQTDKEGALPHQSPSTPAPSLTSATRARRPRTKISKRANEFIMNTWLPILVCLLFLGEAAWRIQWAGFVSYRDILSTELKATAFFNAANFIAFALLGFGCLAWPSLSRWFGSSSSEKQSQEGKDAHAEDDPKAADNLVVVVDKPSAKSTRQKSLEVETSAKEEAVAEEKPPQKGQLIYLTNMKTFLTFIV